MSIDTSRNEAYIPEYRCMSIDTCRNEAYILEYRCMSIDRCMSIGTSRNEAYIPEYRCMSTDSATVSRPVCQSTAPQDSWGCECAIDVCDMTHACVQHGALICVAWLACCGAVYGHCVWMRRHFLFTLSTTRILPQSHPLLTGAGIEYRAHSIYMCAMCTLAPPTPRVHSLLHEFSHKPTHFSQVHV